MCTKIRILPVALLVTAATTFGQSLTSVTGLVSDPTGAVIPNASLTLENLDTAAGRETVSDAKQLVQYTRRDDFNLSAVPRIAYFENLWPHLAASGRTATQSVAQIFADNALDETSALATLDLTRATCSRLGCNAFFSPQYSALAATSSIGSGNYHAMQWTVRKRYSAGLEFDFNYTLSKSIDLTSHSEWASWAGPLTTGYNGFLVNSWEPRQQRGVSDYDALHIYNGWVVWQLPFGRGQRWANTAGGWTNAAIGGWQLTPTLTASSGLPTSLGNGRVWPTNWNITGLATIAGPVNTSIGSAKNAPAISGPGGPNIFGDPNEGIKAFDFTVPGESGNRNILGGDGPFVLSLGVSKRFVMPYSENHSVQFRWETFNITNTARFNVSSLQGNLTNRGTVGKYTETLGDPRQMQLMLRYEF